MAASEVLTNGLADGSANGVVNKFGFKPVDPKEYEQKGMAAYRAPSLLQPHRVRILNVAF
jgi:4-hydroxy-2-oxoheptanedioate aldolase